MSTTKLRRRLRGLKAEMRSVARATLRPEAANPAERQFVLFGRGRTGSTLLVSLLNGHPEVKTRGEILNNPVLAPVALAERELKRPGPSRRGFKLLSYQVRDQMTGPQIRAMRDWIAGEDLTIFHLQRHNLLRHAFSNIYARERQAFHVTEGSQNETHRFRVDPDRIIGWMASSAALFDWEREFLGDLPREEVVYERDLSTPEAQQATADRVVRRLGLEPVPVSSPLKPVTPRSFDSFIENWDEVAQVLADSPWAQHLDG